MDLIKTILRLFHVDLSHQDVSNFSNQIREELSKHLFKKIRAMNLSRRDICSRKTEFVKTFCNNQDDIRISC